MANAGRLAVAGTQRKALGTGSRSLAHRTCGRGLPYPFALYKWMEGQGGDKLLPATSRLDRFVDDYAKFLCSLQQVDVSALSSELDLPVHIDSPIKRLEAMTPWAHEAVDPQVLRSLKHRTPVQLPSVAHVLLHGDLCPEHMLFDEHGTLVGILDWSDAGIGHPLSELVPLQIWFGERAVKRALQVMKFDAAEQTLMWIRDRALARVLTWIGETVRWSREPIDTWVQRVVPTYAWLLERPCSSVPS